MAIFNIPPAPGFNRGGVQRRSTIAREAASDFDLPCPVWNGLCPIFMRDRSFAPHIPRLLPGLLDPALFRIHTLFVQVTFTRNSNRRADDHIAEICISDPGLFRFFREQAAGGHAGKRVGF